LAPHVEHKASVLGQKLDAKARPSHMRDRPATTYVLAGSEATSIIHDAEGWVAGTHKTAQEDNINTTCSTPRSN